MVKALTVRPPEMAPPDATERFVPDTHVTGPVIEPVIAPLTVPPDVAIAACAMTAKAAARASVRVFCLGR